MMNRTPEHNDWSEWDPEFAEFTLWLDDVNADPSAYAWRSDIGWHRADPAGESDDDVITRSELRAVVTAAVNNALATSAISLEERPEFMTMAEFAQLLHVDVKTVERRKHKMTRGVHYIQSGRVVRIRVAEALAWWQGQAAKAPKVDDEMAAFRAKARRAR